MTPHSAPPGSEHISTNVEAQLHRVPADRWHEAVAFLLDRDYTFCSLHATRHPNSGSSPNSEPATDPNPELRAAFARGSSFQMLSCLPAAQPAPTIVDLVPAAAWDEREAAELAGLSFAGHRAQPLISHAGELDSWVTSVTGADTHQVAVGPIHAGIIESGHFRFHVVGERMLHLDLRLFYKHRGLERAAEGQLLAPAIATVQRACAACAVSNSLAYAHACEQALGLTPSAELARARTLLLELERLYNHLHDLAAVCAGVGFAPGNTMFAALKERAQRLNHGLAGHRFLFDTVQVGASHLSISDAAASEARVELGELRRAAARTWHEVLFHGSVQNRFGGVGFVTASDAIALGLVGPAARASGIALDARSDSPRLAYPNFAPVVPEDPSGDVRARVEMRALELGPTFDLLETLLAGEIAPAGCEPQAAATAGAGTAAGTDAAAATGMAAVESPRGRTFCTIEHDGGVLTRVRLRTSSYANWPAVSLAAANEILPEFPLINKSFELCYACCDR